MPVYELNGKVALITGAAQGIGFETARQLHLRGASVAVLDLDGGQAAAAAERIGPRAAGIAADVTDRGAMEAAVAAVVERFGGLDVAIANAGIAPGVITTTRLAPGEEWERVVEVDLLGVWRTCRAALPQIVERRGQLVLIGSIYSFMNGTGNSAYAVAKTGVESLARSLRVELAPLGASSTVAYFGFVDTKLVRDAFEKPNTTRLRETMPAFVTERIEADRAAAALVRAVELRSPRVAEPKWWGAVAALRGFLNPLLDRRMERDPRLAAALREIEADPGAG